MKKDDHSSHFEMINLLDCPINKFNFQSLFWDANEHNNIIEH